MLQSKYKKAFQDVMGAQTLSSEFWQNLEQIANDMSDGKSLLYQQRIRKRIPLAVEEKLHFRISHLVYAHAYYLLLASKRSKYVFDSELTIYIKLNENFHPSNSFQGTMLKVISLVASTSDTSFVGPCLVPKLRTWFHNDCVHLSTWGAKRKTRALTTLIKSSWKCVGAPPSEVEAILSAVAEKIDAVNAHLARKGFTETFGDKPPPLNDQHEHFHYRFRTAKKKMALWVSPTNLREEGPLPATKEKLVAVHATSLNRDLIAHTDFSLRGREEGTLVGCPAVVTVTPGGAAYHLASDLAYCPLLDPIKTPNAYISLIYFGTNEKLLLCDLVYGTLCDEGVIAQSRCLICKRNIKRKKGPKSEDHGLGEILTRFLEIVG